VKVTGAGEELKNDIKKETNFNRSPMPWGPLDPLQKLFIKGCFSHFLHPPFLSSQLPNFPASLFWTPLKKLLIILNKLFSQNFVITFINSIGV
jgi:hypothetical protein